MAPDGQMPSPSDLDLMSFLPPPESPEFPSALFGPLGRRLVGEWLALPAALRPGAWARWRDDAGVSRFDYWLVTRLTWIASISHDESLESQRIALELVEETR
ncbi:hypothetical protein ISF_01534 [Cordyceps fumosorosea ARSEF 2679]|uniref:Uncharacterized protein n=1 Tax=Cordyceps fumosorosea (strain ARSEF 2679) TaxID=1081104 RepID=A0A168DD68_CORFA|nr:hypothetical protein ISF_01534 [Cordyceps fumosorosea ARSEF 2679]OAA72461.1 hypothetical protein ISF_01534 [Cordyceps fumosorosea ARSEF 2679]